MTRVRVKYDFKLDVYSCATSFLPDKLLGHPWHLIMKDIPEEKKMCPNPFYERLSVLKIPVRHISEAISLAIMSVHSFFS